MDEKVTINRQEILTVDGLHYKQDHRLTAIDYSSDYADICSMYDYSPTRVLASESIRYKWQPMASSTPYVEAECQSCGSTNFLFVTRTIKDAIKAGFLKLVAPVTR